MKSKPIKHGTVYGYIGRGCRCESCRDASRRYYGHRPRAVVNAERESQHGTEARYKNYGCRCDACRKASNAARRQRRARAAA